MAAVAPMPEPEFVRLDALHMRTDLNHRSSRKQERVAEYVRKLENGEVPPPILVQRGTNIIVDGNHRFLAAKEFHRKRNTAPALAQIGVTWTDALPDPEKEPELFLVLTAAENRNNGEPLDRGDVVRLIAKVIKKHGKDTARQYAAMLNETPESFEEIYRRLYPPPLPKSLLITTRQVGTQPTGRPVFLTGEFPRTQAPAVQDHRAECPRTPEPPALTAPPPPNIGTMKSTRPAIMEHCRRLREEMDKANGDFTEGERLEMEQTFDALRKKLDK